MKAMSEQPTKNSPSNDDRNTWDVIVIGSGMGGMTAAAALSRVGRKVLLLEQYERPGGLTNSFSRNGFRWDVGIHYLSSFAPGDPERRVLDWLTDEPIEMAPIGTVYDTVHIGNADPIQLSRPTEAQKLDLKERFPEEGDAIDAWFAALREARDAALTVVTTRATPSLVGHAITWWKGRSIERWCERTTAEVIRELTDNDQLAAVFAAQWGDFGGRPGTASFAFHALVVGSYLEKGGRYPVGGPSAFAGHLLPTITSNGGEVRSGTAVESLVFEGDRVVGVRTSKGEAFRADVVVSDIGARETVDKLLPDTHQHQHQDWVDEIRSFNPNICHFSLHLGFEGDIESAGATKSNHWIYPTGQTDAVWIDAPEGAPPGVYVSFASLKDPTHDPGPENRHAGEILAWTDWSVVERWANVPPDKRQEDYGEFKRHVEATLFGQFKEYFPRLAELCVFRELSTPLATAAITGHMKGAFYGLEVTPRRLLSNALRMKTPIDGLYLAGQDAVSPGLPGALWGGVLCAASIEPGVFPHLRGG